MTVIRSAEHSRSKVGWWLDGLVKWCSSKAISVIAAVITAYSEVVSFREGQKSSKLTMPKKESKIAVRYEWPSKAYTLMMRITTEEGVIKSDRMKAT